jgi:hypothetical protein
MIVPENYPAIFDEGKLAFASGTPYFSNPYKEPEIIRGSKPVVEGGDELSKHLAWNNGWRAAYNEAKLKSE